MTAGSTVSQAAVRHSHGLRAGASAPARRSARLMLALGAAAALAAGAAQANEATIRATLSKHLPNFPKIDEVRESAIKGVYEIRIGKDVLYSDATGEHVIQGSMIETRTRTDLTQARIDDLLKVNFADLPLKDAVVIKQGSGARKLVVFGDPNCGYCKKLERDLLTLKDVTVYTFLFPILGDDSVAKSRDIWCAADPGKAWRDWMVDGKSPKRVMGECDTAALERNKALAREHRVTATPAIVFEDGSRSAGALPTKAIEARIASSRKG